MVKAPKYVGVHDYSLSQQKQEWTSSSQCKKLCFVSKDLSHVPNFTKLCFQNVFRLEQDLMCFSWADNYPFYGKYHSLEIFQPQDVGYKIHTALLQQITTHPHTQKTHIYILLWKKKSIQNYTNKLMSGIGSP